MKHGRFFFAIVLGLLVAGCQSTQPRTDARLFDGLGNHGRAVSCSSKLAQRYFNQGLVWTFAFNHDEAIRSFREVARLDPQCAMAWWGVALCNGPHINNPVMSPEQSAAAWDAIQKAQALKSGAAPVEQALIDALTQRYAENPPQDRRPLDQAYASAMREVWRANPQDADIATLYAESLMDLQPWDLWTKDGQPKGATNEILQALQAALRLNPDHPGALHLTIHAVEASATPEKGIAAADRLRKLVPGSGHLTHMPTHIDVLTGRWELASQSNEEAIATDARYRKLSPRQGFYNVYMAHNHHMLAFASMMEGREQTALKAAGAMLAGIPTDFIEKTPALADPFMTVKLDVLKRFGRWDELLAEPAPPARLPYSTAMWRFSRAIAHAAKGELPAAEREQAEFRAAVARVPESTLLMINPARNVLAVAERMLNGEMAYRQGQLDEAVRELREAIALEDQLMYMEPPEWIQPVRHTLGAFLMEAGRYAEAEQVYRQDLKNWPGNGWALYGLSECRKALGGDDAVKLRQEFERAWARADRPITATCLCAAAR